MVIQSTYVNVDSTLQGGSNTGVVGVMDGGFEEAASLNPQEGGGKRRNKLSTKRRKKPTRTKRRRRRTKKRRTKHCKCDTCLCDPCKCNKTNPRKTKLSRKRKDINSFRRNLYDTIQMASLKKYGDITV